MTHVDARTEHSLPVAASRLWTGVLLAPAAWLTAELVGYYLAAKGCEPSRGGIPFTAPAHAALAVGLLALAFAALAGAGLVVAVGNWRATRPLPRPEDPPSWGRAQFLAVTGVLGSALFLLGIVLFGVPTLLVNACNPVR